MMGAVAANVVGLGKFLRILTTTLLIPKVRHSYKPEPKEEFGKKYNNFMGPSAEVIGGVETAFCPKCHAPVARFRRTKQGLQIIRDGKVMMTYDNNVTINAEGKEQRGFPIRCPNGHTVRIE